MNLRQLIAALVALSGAACAPSASRRQCDFIKQGGLAPVAKRYNWQGYFDCQGNQALVPVLVREHLEAGIFDFRKEKVTTLLGPGDQQNAVDGSHSQWMLSPDSKHALWVEVQIRGPMRVIGPRVRIYEIATNRVSEVSLPKREWKPEEGMAGTWILNGFSKDGSSIIFDLALRNEYATINLAKGELALHTGAAPN